MEPPKKLHRDPSLIDDDVIRYLSAQEVDEEEGEGYRSPTDYKPSRLSAELCVKDIMEGVIGTVEWRQLLKNMYEEKKSRLNQADLFDLKKIIPEFEICMSS